MKNNKLRMIVTSIALTLIVAMSPMLAVVANTSIVQNDEPQDSLYILSENYETLFSTSLAELESVVLENISDTLHRLDIGRDAVENTRGTALEIPEEILEFRGDAVEALTTSPGSWFHDAATGFQNRVVRQRFTTPGQRDHFYRFQVTAGRQYVFMLTNLSVPHKLYISNGDWWATGSPANPGTAQQGFVWTANFTGTLFVIVDSLFNIGMTNQNYVLYFGDIIRHGSVYQRQQSFNFGNFNPPGQDQWPPPPRRLSPTQSVNFHNHPSVPPSDSWILSINIHPNISSGNGMNLRHHLTLRQAVNSQLIQLSQNNAFLISHIYSTNINTLHFRANQQMTLWGCVTSSLFLAWNPSIRMDFVFSMNFDNLWWMVHNNI